VEAARDREKKLLHTAFENITVFRAQRTFLRATALSAHMLSQFRLSVRLSICLSVCHTGDSCKNRLSVRLSRKNAEKNKNLYKRYPGHEQVPIFSCKGQRSKSPDVKKTPRISSVHTLGGPETLGNWTDGRILVGSQRRHLFSLPIIAFLVRSKLKLSGASLIHHAPQM